jgi:hypothetical protein
MGNIKQWLIVEIIIFYVNFLVLFVFLLVAYIKDGDEVLKDQEKDI